MSNNDLSPYVKKKEAQIWYMEDVNIQYSFESLEYLAQQLGANIEEGDIFIADNEKKTKRKIFRKVNSKYIIVYLSVPNRNKFLTIKNGKGKLDRGSMLEYCIFN